MAAVLKTAVAMSHRGFESLSLRQSLSKYEMAIFDCFQAVFEAIAISEDIVNAVGASWSTTRMCSIGCSWAFASEPASHRRT